MEVNFTLQLQKQHGYYNCSMYQLNGGYVVFGKVLENFDVVKMIESKGSNTGKPSAWVVFASCEELPLDQSSN